MDEGGCLLVECSSLSCALKARIAGQSSFGSQNRALGALRASLVERFETAFRSFNVGGVSRFLFV